MSGKYVPNVDGRTNEVGIPFPPARTAVGKRRPVRAAGCAESPLPQRHDTEWHA